MSTKEIIPDDIKAMGFTEAKADVKLITYKTKPLGKYDADVRVTYNGMFEMLGCSVFGRVRCY
jgi:hypothetical protein